MAYNKFTLSDIKESLGYDIDEKRNLFFDTRPQAIGNFLTETLAESGRRENFWHPVFYGQ